MSDLLIGLAILDIWLFTGWLDDDRPADAGPRARLPARGVTWLRRCSKCGWGGIATIVGAQAQPECPVYRCGGIAVPFDDEDAPSG